MEGLGIFEVNFLHPETEEPVGGLVVRPRFVTVESDEARPIGAEISVRKVCTDCEVQNAAEAGCTDTVSRNLLVDDMIFMRHEGVAAGVVLKGVEEMDDGRRMVEIDVVDDMCERIAGISLPIDPVEGGELNLDHITPMAEVPISAIIENPQEGPGPSATITLRPNC